MLVGYARTSTEEQIAGLEAQVLDLRAAGCFVHEEHASSVGNRPVFEWIIDNLQRGDTLVVTKLDRLARSVIGLWKIVDRLEDKGAALRILNFGGETIDTKSATGRLVLTMFAGFAQFERETMLERQSVGIAKAKEEGKYKGRKSKADAYHAAKLHRDGMSVREIATRLSISKSAVGRAIGRVAA